MLSVLSKFARSFAGKILTGIMAVGLVGFGITNVITGLGSQTVAESGGQELSIRDFSRGYQDYVNLVARQMGRVPTDAEAAAMGIPGYVLQQFRSDAAINKLTSDMGIGVSEDRLREVIQQDPAVANVLGTFDRSNFKQALQQLGYTENEYMDLKSRTVRREQLESALFDDAPVPNVARDLIKRFSGDKRSIDYFVLNAESLPPVADPTEQELADYLAAHQSEFRTVETRQIDLLALSPVGLAASKTPTEEEIAAEYERTKDTRVRVEKRTIGQIVLNGPEQAAQFTEGQSAGKTLADLLTETGLTTTSLGTLSRDQINDSAVAEAAFSLPVDGYAIIDGIGGNKRVVTVSAIEPGGQISLEEAHDAIATQLAQAAARSEYNDILDQIEELRAAFKPLTEIAERFGLPLHQLALTASGAELSVLTDLPAEDRPRVTTRIFAAEQGDLAPMISLGSSYNVWFDLKQIEAARDQTLDEVRDQVVAAWTKQKEDAEVAEAVAKVLDDLKAGVSFADAAVAANQFPQLTQPLTRSGDGGVIDGTVASAVFEGGEGHYGSAINSAGDQVVFQVVEVVAATDDPPATATQYVERGTRDALYADFVSGVTADVGFRVNQNVLEQVLGSRSAQ